MWYAVEEPDSPEPIIRMSEVPGTFGEDLYESMSLSSVRQKGMVELATGKGKPHSIPTLPIFSIEETMGKQESNDEPQCIATY